MSIENTPTSAAPSPQAAVNYGVVKFAGVCTVTGVALSFLSPSFGSSLTTMGLFFLEPALFLEIEKRKKWKEAALASAATFAAASLALSYFSSASLVDKMLRSSSFIGTFSLQNSLTNKTLLAALSLAASGGALAAGTRGFLPKLSTELIINRFSFTFGSSISSLMKERKGVVLCISCASLASWVALSTLGLSPLVQVAALAFTTNIAASLLYSIIEGEQLGIASLLVLGAKRVLPLALLPPPLQAGAIALEKVAFICFVQTIFFQGANYLESYLQKELLEMQEKLLQIQEDLQKQKRQEEEMNRSLNRAIQIQLSRLRETQQRLPQDEGSEKQTETPPTSVEPQRDPQS